MGNFQSVHVRKGARKDFSSRGREEIHLVIIDLRLSEGEFGVRGRSLGSEELLLWRTLGMALFGLLFGYGGFEAAALLEESVGRVDRHPTGVRLVICGTCHISLLSKI